MLAVAEPIQHYATPPPASGVAPQTGAAAATAMQYTLFHWTLLAAALLLAGGLVALPFVVVMLGLAVAVLREMAADPMLRAGPRPRRSGLAAAVRAARSYEEEDPAPVTRWFHSRRR
ncbi:BCCT family transporter [Micromonospora sp. B006]|uniref:BCCT family transporter n=1 Tax=Micromonospora sp. B006 TaxID=2201999 RepID=UPI000E332438|nr:BCCT family transporter [Micromonospora sp. B006]AXO36103.1 glycine betaine transporter OpuD [Micromonospora sp. B006]